MTPSAWLGRLPWPEDGLLASPSPAALAPSLESFPVLFLAHGSSLVPSLSPEPSPAHALWTATGCFCGGIGGMGSGET